VLGQHQHFTQRLVRRTDECVITLLESAPIAKELRIDGALALEPGAPVVWFTFPGAWHDIGRFHDRHGRFTGWYANILTPVAGLETNDWSTTDLCLDIWLPPGGRPVLLDEDELAAAEAAGAVSAALAERARAEAERIMTAAQWPPRIASEWTLAPSSARWRSREAAAPREAR
jgi:predicted RNA-binding protein associated with RNAse of E/G family